MPSPNAQPSPPVPATPGALAGLRVLDLSTFIAGPFCGGMLAEYGADVVKVEQPGVGDSLRELGPKTHGRGLFWALEARGRRSVTLNLREARGQTLALRLIAESDIVIENFRPGTLERWNLGFEELQAVTGLSHNLLSSRGRGGDTAAEWLGWSHGGRRWSWVHERACGSRLRR